MKGPVRIGVVGCGNVLGHYMETGKRLREDGHAEFVVAYDRDAGRGRAAAQRFGFARAADTEEAVVAAADVDLVLVLSPTQAHGPTTIAALQAGKHVIVEKTIAPTLDEARRVLDTAARSPGHLVCAPHVLLSPTYQAMWRRVRGGEIGKPLSARARYGWADSYWQGGWVYRKGAGALFEFAVYNVTSLTGLLGPVRRVTAMTEITVPERHVGGERVRVEEEDNAQVLLDFGDGVLAVVTTGFVMQRYRSPAIEIYGSTGTVQMLGDDWEPRGHELWRNDAACWTLFDETDPRWSWTDGLRHTVACIRTGKTPVVTATHAHHVLEVLLAARAAGGDGRTRTIESRFDMPSLTEGVA